MVGRPEDAPHFDEIIQSWNIAFSDTDGSGFVGGAGVGKLGAEKYPLRRVRDRVEFTESVHAVKRSPPGSR